MKKSIISIVCILIISLVFSTVCLAKTGSIQNSDYLNLRESATTSSNLLVKMPGDATFEIIGEENDWYKVKYKDYTGYVSKQYVKVEETVVNTNIPAKANAKGIINKESDVYTLPLLNSIKLDKISSNSEVTVISIVEKWAYIQNESISGWIFANNVNGIEESENKQDNNIEDDNNKDSDQENNQSNNNQENNQGNDQNNNNQDNNQGNDQNNNNQDNNQGNGQNNNNQDNNQGNDQNNDNQDNNQGDQSNNNQDNQQDNNQQPTSNNYPRTMYVNVDAVYIRAQTSTDSEKVTSIGLNTPVMVRGEEGDWYKVETNDGSGYMMKKYLSNEKQGE